MYGGSGICPILRMKLVPLTLARLTLAPLPKEEMLPDPDLPPGTPQAFPVVGIALELAREQNLNAPMQEIPCRGIARTHHLRPQPTSSSIKARRKHARVVEYDQVARPQQVRKITELPVLQSAAL